MNCNIQELIIQAGLRKALEFYQLFAQHTIGIFDFMQRFKKYFSRYVSKESAIFLRKIKRRTKTQIYRRIISVGNYLKGQRLKAMATQMCYY